MRFYPAIDLKDGNCVRLLRGDMDEATVFSESPADQARAFEAQGAQYLHIVDLNGAFAGKAVNFEPVQAILESINIPAQLGGGIRDMQMVEYWLNLGMDRVILGTIAAKDPDFVKAAAKIFPGHIAVGIDARGGFVATQGWAETTNIKATELAQKFEDAGVAAIIYTDIDRDGAMQGPNIAATHELAKAVSIPVIASGGVSSLEDLQAIIASGAPLDGVISGRAIYEGKINIAEAVALLKVQNA